MYVIMRSNYVLYIYNYYTSITSCIVSGSPDDSSVTNFRCKLTTIVRSCSTLSRMFCTCLPKLTQFTSKLTMNNVKLDQNAPMLGLDTFSEIIMHQSSIRIRHPEVRIRHPEIKMRQSYSEYVILRSGCIIVVKNPAN
jgi:hypothetical protein